MIVEATGADWTALELSWEGGVINAEPAGWMDPGFDDSAWPAAVVDGAPVASWYDIPGCDFIYDGPAKTNGRISGGIFIARHEFTIVEQPVGALLTATADNWGDFYLDGVLVAAIVPNEGGVTGGSFKLPHSYVIDPAMLTPGDHCLAVKVRNGVGVNTWDNPMMAQAVLSSSESIGWDAYAAAAPNGDILATLQTHLAPVEGATERMIRVALKEPGQGSFKINRYSPVATEAVCGRGNIVKVRLPWRTDYDFAFILEKGDFKLASAAEKAGEEFSFGGRGILAYLDRAVMDAVAYTTGLDISDTWTQIWKTSKVPNPVGSAVVDGDPTFLYVISATTRRIYKIRQSDRVVVGRSPELWAGSTRYAGGLGADPADPTILWVLESPWALGGGGNTKIRKVSIAGGIASAAVVSTFNLGSAVKLTAIKADATHLYVTKWDGPDGQQRSKATGAVTDTYSVIYGGVAQTNATGLSINGSKIAWWFNGTKRALIADLADPETITDKISTKGISAFGGDWSTEGAEDFFYPVSYTADTVWKYQVTVATPHDPVDLKWRLDEGSPGAILWRIIEEALAPGRPQAPFPDLTIDFDQATDSNGAAWATHDGTLEFDANVTDPVLATALRLIPYGLIERMSPRLLLRAFNASTYGTDRTGAFGVGQVRFEKGVNIIPELGRQDREREQHSHMLATGKDGIYARAVLNDLGYVREGGIRTDLEDATALEGTAGAELADERVRSERIRFAVPIGDDQAAGLYLPFTHYDVGDLVTLHTGTGEHHFNEEAFVLYAIQLIESKGGSFEKAILELGSPTLVDAPSSGGAAGGGTTSGGAGGGSGMGGGPSGSGSTSVIVEDSLNGESYSGKRIRSDDIGVSQSEPGIVDVTIRFPRDEDEGVLVGDLTIDGTPFAVTVGATHKAFVSASWMTNPAATVHGVGDKFLIVYRDGDDHVANGKLMGIIATVSDMAPFTATLGAAFTIEDLANDIRPQGPAVSTLDIGGGDYRIVIVADEYTGVVNTAVHVLVSQVASDAVTNVTGWDRHNVGAPLTGHTQDAANGRMFKLADGTFLMAAQYVSAGATHVVILKSADVTFAAPTMHEVTAAGYNEMGVVVMPDGISVRGHLRNDAQTTISGVASDDGGETWSAPVVRWNGGGFPSWDLLPSGIAVATGRSASPTYDTAWYWTAFGATDEEWSAEDVISTALDHGAYGDILKIDNNTALILYADETGEAVPLDANIAWQVITDSTAFRSSGTVAVSEADANPDFLEDKLVAGAGVTLTKLGTGGDERLEVAANATPVEDILDLPTTEVDAALVLAPDGAGGVEFRAETATGTPATDTAAWMPLTTIDTDGNPALVWDDDLSLIATLVPL